MKNEKLKHVELMEDNNIALIDLPKEIKNKINALTPTISRYNKNPSEKLKDAIIKQDIGIADLIADYIEKDLPDSDEDELDEEITPPIIPAVVAPIVEEIKEEPVIAPVIIEPIVAPIVVAPLVERKAKQGYSGTLDMENQILEECKANGYISSEKLAKIIGKSEWGLSVSYEDVFSIRLKKSWQTKFYKLV